MADKIVSLAIPMHDTVSAWSVMSIANMMTELLMKEGYKLMLNMRIDNPVCKNRNFLVKKALDVGADYVWFVDSDMVIIPKTFDKLLNEDKDIISALAFRKYYRSLPTIYKNTPNGYKIIPIKVFGPIIEVDAVGMGCTLIKTEVFEKMEKPWFKFEVIDKDKMHYVGEDITFCKYAQKAGFKIYCHTGIVAEHVGGFVGSLSYLSKNYPELVPKLMTKKSSDEDNEVLEDFELEKQ